MVQGRARTLGAIRRQKRRLWTARVSPPLAGEAPAVHTSAVLPILDLPAFAAALPARAAVLGIDPGEKRIGIAVSDTTRLIASSLDTVARGKFADDAAAILKLYDARQCAGFVIGLPLNMDGTRGEAARRVERFIADLRRIVSIPIVAVDERLTSLEADRLLRAEGANERERRRRSDEYAAVIILEDYLASRGRIEPDSP